MKHKKQLLNFSPRSISRAVMVLGLFSQIQPVRAAMQCGPNYFEAVRIARDTDPGNLSVLSSAVQGLIVPVEEDMHEQAFQEGPCPQECPTRNHMYTDYIISELFEDTEEEGYWFRAVNGYLAISCDAESVSGCMDPAANNYKSLAGVDDGSCTYTWYGCTNPSANNYNSQATSDDGSCTFDVYGCTQSGAVNYNALANIDDGSCYYE